MTMKWHVWCRAEETRASQAKVYSRHFRKQSVILHTDLIESNDTDDTKALLLRCLSFFSRPQKMWTFWPLKAAGSITRLVSYSLNRFTEIILHLLVSLDLISNLRKLTTYFFKKRRYKIVVSEQVEISNFRDVDRVRGRGFSALAQIIGEQQFVFPTKNQPQNVSLLIYGILLRQKNWD